MIKKLFILLFSFFCFSCEKQIVFEQEEQPVVEKDTIWDSDKCGCSQQSSLENLPIDNYNNL